MPWEWDEVKDASNLRKHGIDFALASLVFQDPFLRVKQDASESEQRWQSFGMIGNAYIMVVHTGRIEEIEAGATGRIISARRMTRHERRWYEQVRP